MAWIALLQTSSLAEWRKAYGAHVRSADDLEAVGSRAWTEFQEYLKVAACLTEADFQEYVRELAQDRTFEGWSNRREAVRRQLFAQTEIPFDYLRDHPLDWRPRTYDIDFAAKHPTAGSWLAVKALPLSTRDSGGPGVPARLAAMRDKHAEFNARWGSAVVVYFSTEKKKTLLSAAEVDRVRAAWNAL